MKSGTGRCTCLRLHPPLVEQAGWLRAQAELSRPCRTVLHTRYGTHLRHVHRPNPETGPVVCSLAARPRQPPFATARRAAVAVHPALDNCAQFERESAAGTASFLACSMPVTVTWASPCHAPHSTTTLETHRGDRRGLLSQRRRSSQPNTPQRGGADIPVRPSRAREPRIDRRAVRPVCPHRRMSAPGEGVMRTGCRELCMLDVSSTKDSGISLTGRVIPATVWRPPAMRSCLCGRCVLCGDKNQRRSDRLLSPISGARSRTATAGRGRGAAGGRGARC
jgi:hypothetical protein